jgi:hypothetical protein
MCSGLFHRNTRIVTSGFCAHSQLYPNNAVYSVTPNMINLPKSLTTTPNYFALLAQSLHFQNQSEPAVWNWLFRRNRPNRILLIKLNLVVTVSRAFGLKPLPNQSLHGRMPRAFLVNPCCPVRHSP